MPDLVAKLRHFATRAREIGRKGGLAGILSGAQRRRRHQHAQQAFDRRYGTETLAVLPLGEFSSTDAPLSHAYEYHASSALLVSEMMDRLPIDRADHTLIDLGCGKALVMMMAAKLGFRRIIGVEFEPMLHQRAAQNIALFKAQEPAAPPIEIVQGDAGAYAFPPEPLVLYLFNPFGPDVVRRTLANLRQSLADHPRSCWIIYLRPLHHDLFVQSGFLSVHEDRSQATDGDWVIYEARV